MVATRALIQDGAPGTEAALRTAVRDLVALSSLPAIWIKANPTQVAKSLAQLIVSMLDADFSCVVLQEYEVDIAECHNRTADARQLDARALRGSVGTDGTTLVDDPSFGLLRSFSVPVGRQPGAYLMAVSHREGFPNETERTLMRVAANQAAVVLQRWKSEQSLIQQKQTLEALNQTNTALYGFTDKLHRATSLKDIYDAALEAIATGLDCRRASILRSDHDSVMRFVAWRDLSEEYRNAVEGHSPWKTTDLDPQPICIADVDAAEIPTLLKSALRAEGIGALAFIPLVVNEAVIGKFMAYYDAPRQFKDGDIELALTLARQLGFSIERRRIEEARRSAEEFNRSVVASSHDSIKILDVNGRLLMMAEAGQPLLDVSDIREFSGKSWIEFWKGDDRNAAETAVKTAAMGGIGKMVGLSNMMSGEPKWWDVIVSPINNADGRPDRFLAISRDITNRKKAEEQRELLVAELSHRVKNTLATVISVARRSLTADKDVEEAKQSFEARIRALAQTHTHLAEANWSGVALESILRDELAPYRREDLRNVRIDGPPIVFNPKSALMLGMAVHELATNAAKYGALSTKEGVVAVTWELRPAADEISIRWMETGGPRVQPSPRRGFGRLLLERALAADLGGQVQLDFDEQGLKCHIKLPFGKSTVPLANKHSLEGN